MPETSDQRHLADRLSGLGDDELAALFTRRAVTPGAAWRDFFDAAEGLLDASAIDRALLRLPRPALAAALAPAPTPRSTELDAHALTDDTGTPYARVSERARVAASAQPAAFEPRTPPAEPVPADEVATAAAAERVFTTVAVLADVLVACLHTPFARTGAGPVSVSARRRLADEGVLDSSEQLDDLVSAAAIAGLLRGVDREWVVTTAAQQWLNASTAHRWQIVAEALRDTLPPTLRTPAGGYLPMSAWPDAFPLDPDWQPRSHQLVRIATAWALTATGDDEPAWAQGLRQGRTPALESLTSHLPAEIDRVYLQADLTAIAPGPLAPALDLRLRSIAHRESRAQASTYRFSADSLRTGMADGETAATIREFLSALSLTGIPQPLDYLIESTAARHGLVTVQTDAATGRTRIDSADPALRDTLAVDQALRPLGLVPDDAALTTRVARDAVYWSLVDARYPVVAVDGAGEPLSLRRRSVARDAPAAPEAPYARLISTLRAAEGDDADAAWLERELDQAVRLRSTIAVVVRLPDGVERTFTLEATGLGGGRLRGRDRGADIERTLPLSNIVSVRPVA